MSRLRGLCILGLVAMGVASTAVPAQAQLYKGVAEGLSLLDFRFSGQRNLLGDGITINANAAYSQRTFDFGVGNLTLTGPVNMSAGFTRRGIPGANFSLNTGGSNLSYTFNINNGGQNLTVNGQALVNVNAHVNGLGFYNETVQVSNRGTYTTTGLAGETTGPISFDVGPINKSGNLLADLIGNLTQPIFSANNLENPFSKFSSQSMKLTNAMKSVDELRAKAASGETLNEQELSELVNDTILVSVLGGKPSDTLLDGFVFNPDSSTLPSLSGFQITPTPEPATMGVVIFLLASGLAMRRRPG